jgi:hypothetical protein
LARRACDNAVWWICEGLAVVMLWVLAGAVAVYDWATRNKESE